MHVLMLGWEFPPFITGGLGTACHGLTRALDRHGVRVTFALPKTIDRSQASHVDLISPDMPPQISGSLPGAPESSAPHGAAGAPMGASSAPGSSETTRELAEQFKHVRFVDIPSEIVQPYDEGSGQAVGEWVIEHGVRRWRERAGGASRELASGMEAESSGPAAGSGASSSAIPDYSGDLLAQVDRYARFCVAATRSLRFDVIHAHDWMTYPAGMAVARLTGRPLVAHVHSTEFDRSGMNVNRTIYDIERRGMSGAMRVIAVSQLTKNLVVGRYGIPDHRVEVVYNGVELEPVRIGITGIESKDKIVLYFGRITYQKGPEYFIAAAKRVLDVMQNVKFVVAGSGDQAARMIELAARLGIGHKVLFTGFLRGRDIQRVFALADMYVMPSVSEPFGIAPLEAMAHDVPVLISRSSGVSEVLTHALKVDFWDVDEMANKIVAVLRHPPLSKTLREHGHFEVRRLTWDGAATRCTRVYESVIDDMRHHPVHA